MSSGDWKRSLALVLKDNNGKKAIGGSVSSYATQAKRSEVLFAGFKTLRTLGYKLHTVHSFKNKHMEALATYWETNGLSPSTIQNNISIFKTFAGWIGKGSMRKPSHEYVQKKESVQRSSINTVDKSWQINVAQKIAEVSVHDPRIGMALALQHQFGLRVKESLLLRPHLADKGDYLLVNIGTKGGRDRVVPIVTAEQRDLLERAKQLTMSEISSISDPSKSLLQLVNHYYRVVREHGITKENGLTSHGLRHAYANDLYKKITAQDSPVRSENHSKPNVSKNLDAFARLEIAEQLGHSRTEITTHYLGR
jgi:integrase